MDSVLQLTAKVRLRVRRSIQYLHARHQLWPGHRGPEREQSTVGMSDHDRVGPGTIVVSQPGHQLLRDEIDECRSASGRLLELRSVTPVRHVRGRIVAGAVELVARRAVVSDGDEEEVGQSNLCGSAASGEGSPADECPEVADGSLERTIRFSVPHQAGPDGLIELGGTWRSLARSGGIR